MMEKKQEIMAEKDVAVCVGSLPVGILDSGEGPFTSVLFLFLKGVSLQVLTFGHGMGRL